LDNAIIYLDKYISCKYPPDYSYLCSHITRTIHIALALHHFLYSVTLDNQGEVIFWIAYSTISNPKTKYDANTTNQIVFTLSYFRSLFCSRLTIGSQIFNLYKILFNMIVVRYRWMFLLRRVVILFLTKYQHYKYYFFNVWHNKIIFLSVHL
jgi:hypothetical protein